MKSSWKSGSLLLAFCATVVGCADSKGPSVTATKSQGVDSKYVLTTEPENVSDVMAARKDTKDGDEVSIVGRIGGSQKPFIDGVAAFTIVDMSMKHCPDEEGCPTPWDYCCVTDKLPHTTAMVKIVDKKGNTVSSDARELLGVKELTTIVAKGKAKRDDSGNLTVMADCIFIRQ